MKTKGKIFLAVLFLLLCVVAAGFFFVSKQISPVSASSDDVRFEIAQGDSVRVIAENLENLELIRDKRFFYYYVRSPSLFSILFKDLEITTPIVLKSGIYHLKPGMTYKELVTELSSGQQEYIKVAIPEGKTISQTAAILEEAGICTVQDFKDACRDPAMLAARGIIGESAEGFLFPETYFLTKGMTAADVVSLMIDTFFEKISTIPGMSEKSASDLYNTVILASIVEREYRVEEEAPLIASVFTNRLRHNIGLYSCATIVYILTEIEGRPHPERVLLEDTKIDNPYNTYKWAGLTPGPISNPGLVALNAAANPPKTNYYFFQVSDSKAGKHVFTTTFDEHKASHNLSTKN